MFAIHTKKHGKTYKRELENIKRKIVDGHDRGVCDSYGRTIEKDGKGPQTQAGKGDRNRIRQVLDLEDLYKRASDNLWPRDEEGNLIGD
jgi:hypothetical protein